ncbi:MAG: peptidoglycan DD-metalloendopeptidase family protein [Propionivibrio sp.]|nr:peptidoglycan DD-metalloendopeptidase family protein [Propionivibrio sp.]
MTRRFYSVVLAALLTILTMATGSALALPLASNVPGGIARVPLGTLLDYPDKPKAWLDGQSVWVAADDGHWVAVVGVPLDTPTGTKTLRVATNRGERSVSFPVVEKRYAEQHVRLKDSSKITLSPDDEKRALAEIERIQSLKKHWREIDDTDSNFIRPADGRLSSRFGLRRIFNGAPRAPHSGLDFAAPRGAPVITAASGRVLAIDDYFFNGKTVFVDHGNGLLSMYCHLDRIDVQPGDTLRKGQRLGLAGATGRASGPHLHWSVVLNGTMVDPELFLTQR